MNCQEIIKEFKKNLRTSYHKEPKDATPQQLHEALSRAIVSEIEPVWMESMKLHDAQRRACYFSAEFLVGRAIYNNLLCLNIREELESELSKIGVSLSQMEDIEDAALGNGGLGRLAACFLDSAATMGLPLDGYGIRYKYGLFKQRIQDGFQIEEADNWTEYGDPWSMRFEEEAVIVHYADQTVRAVPYDMPIIGYCKNHVSNLRLWQAEAINDFDFLKFNNSDYHASVQEKENAENITQVLYPNDNTEEGKILRLKQQYFFCSASLQDIILRFKRNYNSDFSKFSEYYVIQLNDTHPVISIPEFIRLLMDQEDYSFEDAFAIAQKTFAYTNHTIMSEALEKWHESYLQRVIPRVFEIVQMIDEKFVQDMRSRNLPEDKIASMRILQNATVHMAHMAIYGSSFVNGVAQLHTEILKKDVLKDWYHLYPERIQNKTNGITQRRWLALCNRELAALITELLGSNRWITNLDALKELEKYADNKEVLTKFVAIKKAKRKQLSEFVLRHDGLTISPDTVFDVQVKRLHEYKRQLLNILGILYLYFEFKDGNLKDFAPTTFIFGAKAAPGYDRAKGIIKFINEVATYIDNDVEASKYFNIVFLSNYNVSYAEKIIAATDVSEQISTAGTEASGTGNMKFMLNGAVTLGTYDGANIEIVQEAGLENNYIFGAKVEEIKQISNSYNPKHIYESNPKIKRVLDTLVDGTFSDGGSGIFRELYQAILDGASWHKPDHYYLLLDLEDYVQKRLQVNRDTQDTLTFAKKCWVNMCNAGKFSSDRTIADYVENIWKIKPVI